MPHLLNDTNMFIFGDLYIRKDVGSNIPIIPSLVKKILEICYGRIICVLCVKIISGQRGE